MMLNKKDRIGISTIAKIFKMRAEGDSYYEISKEVDITPEAVRQTITRVSKIVKDYNKKVEN